GPSENWPLGAISFSDAVQTDFGHYLDFELASQANQIGFLINNRQGENVTDDFNLELLSPDMNEAWVTADHEVYSYEPLDSENSMRVNYVREGYNYNDLGLWTWGDVAEPTDDWPDGAHSFEKGMSTVWPIICWLGNITPGP